MDSGSLDGRRRAQSEIGEVGSSDAEVSDGIRPETDNSSSVVIPTPSEAAPRHGSLEKGGIAIVATETMARTDEAGPSQGVAPADASTMPVEPRQQAGTTGGEPESETAFSGQPDSSSRSIVIGVVSETANDSSSGGHTGGQQGCAHERSFVGGPKEAPDAVDTVQFELESLGGSVYEMPQV